MKVLPNHEKLIYCGRIDWEEPCAPVFVYPCTYVKMRFTGNTLRIHVKNKNLWWDNYAGCILDGVQSSLPLPLEGEAVLEVPVNDTENGEHDLLFFKRQDACHEMTLLDFELEEGAKVLDCPPEPERKIEVYGDSVSAGEVSEAIDYVGKEDPEHHGQFSNGWYSYAWMTARKLHAQIHDTAQGGIALMDHTGYFCEPEADGMETAWNRLHYNPLLGDTTPWDFSGYTPQVVIVAIGQNDGHPEDYMKEDEHSEKAAVWKEHYKSFLHKLRETYPKAKIVCCMTLLNHDPAWDRAIGQVVEEMGDDDITQYLFKRNGKGTPGHLRIPEAEEMADELAAYIETLDVEGWEHSGCTDQVSE